MQFTLFGFPVEIQPGAFMLAGVVLLFGLGTSASMSWLVSLIVVGAFSILVHELGHALSARAFGATPISIALHGFGGATRHAPTGAWYKEVLVILAGPGAGFALAALLGVISFLPLPSAVQGIVVLGVQLNIVWGLFNLLPLFPMDGGQALAFGLYAFVTPITAWLIVHVLGIGIAIVVALYALSLGSWYTPMLLGMFGYQNWQGLQRMMTLRRERTQAA